MASPKQRDFTGNVKFKIADTGSAKTFGYPIEVETVRRAIQKNSHTERCCGMILAPILLSNVSRILFLFLYVILIAGASYSVNQMDVHFS